MRFTSSPLKLVTTLLLSLVIAGCATNKKERDVSLPSWVDIYDRYDEEGKRKEKKEEPAEDREEGFAPESSADASDRLASTQDADEQEEAPSQAEEEKAGSLFDYFFGKKKEDTKKETPVVEAPQIAEEPTPEETTPPVAELQQQPAEEQPATQELAKTPEQPETADTEAKQPAASESVEPVTPAEPPKPVIPKPKPLTAKNEQHALEAQKASPDYQRALQKLKAGELKSALLIFQELSNRFPTLSGPIVNQSIILRKQGKPNQAKAILQKAILNKTQNPYLMNELGLVNRELGKFESAKQSYLSAIRLEPNYDKAHYNLAVLADLYLHDPALAFQEFEAYQALQETPNKKVAGWLKEIKRRIK